MQTVLNCKQCKQAASLLVDRCIADQLLSDAQLTKQFTSDVRSHTDNTQSYSVFNDDVTYSVCSMTVSVTLTTKFTVTARSSLTIKQCLSQTLDGLYHSCGCLQSSFESSLFTLYCVMNTIPLLHSTIFNFNLENSISGATIERFPSTFNTVCILLNIYARK